MRCLLPLRRGCVFPSRPYSSDSLPTSSSSMSPAARLVQLYRDHGHQQAKLNPLAVSVPTRYNRDVLREAREACRSGLGAEGIALEKFLEEKYCGGCAIQTSHMVDETAKMWILREWESRSRTLPSEYVPRLFQLIHHAELLDHFFHRKFRTVKRYSLEGAEAMIPAVDLILHGLASNGVESAVIGMPHRGRLNLMVELLGAPLRDIIRKMSGGSEFTGYPYGIGDVLSHLAYSGMVNVGASHNQRSLQVSLLHNPSHLEAANPVVLGKVRAQRDADVNAAGILLHGDAAFAGQGVVAECFAFSEIDEFSTGGTVHVIVNNQLGFTTSSLQARSSHHASDVAKMIGAPLIHCNAESLADVVFCSSLAADYRSKFGTDVLLELVGYRRHGHNEVDEPTITNPVIYSDILSRSSIIAMFKDEIEKSGILSPEAISKDIESFTSMMDAEFAAASEAPKYQTLERKWSGMKFLESTTSTEYISPENSGISSTRLREIAELSVRIPEQITPHARMKRTHMEARLARVASNVSDQDSVIDWATAEAVAVGSLLQEGFNVRLSGQDVARGTFSQRHFGIFDQNTGNVFYPFKNLGDAAGKFSTVNSLLSEFAVMGFEYGYSIDDPKNLVLWEAQFGDFNNGAQIIIDQFISSGEAKWLRQSGLVLLCPHGFDGAGPEHSSGRLERFLQLVDASYDGSNGPDKNVSMHIGHLTTPANYFHALRRQCLRPFRKPLILMSPKTVLRLPEATSSLAEMGPSSCFQPVLDDPQVSSPAQIDTLVLCSGKVYYDMKKEASSRKASSLSFVRIEELAPFPYEKIGAIRNRYGNVSRLVWLQEEPQNLGAYAYVAPKLETIFGKKFEYVGRPPCPASAVGFSSVHKKEFADIASALFA